MKSRDITFDLEFNTSAEVLWNYFLESEKLESWLTKKAKVDPETGGGYELFWEPETPTENSTIDCKILALVPNQLLSFEWRGPVPFADIMNIKPFPTWASVSMERISVNETVLHFRHTGWGDSEKWEEARAWQEKAWGMAFNNLKELCES